MLLRTLLKRTFFFQIVRTTVVIKRHFSKKKTIFFTIFVKINKILCSFIPDLIVQYFFAITFLRIYSCALQHHTFFISYSPAEYIFQNFDVQKLKLTRIVF